MSEKLRRLLLRQQVPGNSLACFRLAAAQGGQPKSASPAKPRKSKNKAHNKARPVKMPSRAAVERARVAAILRSDQAKGREDYAQCLALDTNLTAVQAVKVLGTVAKGTGHRGLARTSNDSVKAVAARMAGHVNRQPGNSHKVRASSA